MDSFQFWQCFITNACLYGKAFAEIVRNGAGQVAELWPIPTPYVLTQRNTDTNELEYIVNTPTGEHFLLRRQQVLSLTWFSEDGINPFKPLQLAQNAIGLNIATEEFGSNYFKNGANVSGVIEYPANYTDEQYTRFRKSVREAYAGLSNSAKLMFLEEGSKFNKISNNPEESQMLETRKFQVEEIARFYNVPPHMIMQLERATFSNIEQQSINFVVYTLRPWLVRIEKALKAQLLTPAERGRYFMRFNADALLRGDLQSRFQAFAVARQNGWMSANDIRDANDMNKIPAEKGGDEFLVNGNMISILTAANQQFRQQQKTSGGEKQ
jgi:HK97 family phage portal protein